MAIPDDRGDESFADDLNMWPGIVSGRVALLLRSTEIQPAAAPICPLLHSNVGFDVPLVEKNTSPPFPSRGVHVTWNSFTHACALIWGLWICPLLHFVVVGFGMSRLAPPTQHTHSFSRGVLACSELSPLVFGRGFEKNVSPLTLSPPQHMGVEWGENLTSPLALSRRVREKCTPTHGR